MASIVDTTGNPYGVKNILKIVHRNKGPENLLLKNDPLLRTVKSEKIEGKEYRFAALFGRGGAVSADYLTSKAAARQTVRNVEWKITPGYLNSAFTLTQNEILASKSRTGAYIRATGEKVFASLEAARKTLARCLYGSGFGEMGKPLAAVAVVTNAGDPVTIYVDEVTAASIDIGSNVAVATGAPSGTLKSGIGNVTKIGTKVSAGIPITLTWYTDISLATVAKNPAIAVTDWIVLAGNQFAAEGSGIPVFPVGLGGWLPSVRPTTGDNFFGIDRTVATDRLAGQFVSQADLGGSATKVDTITELFRLCVRAGGLPDSVMLNDQDFADLLYELGAKEKFLQSINGSAPDKLAVTSGKNEVAWAFATSWIGKTIPSPYIPKGTFYILEKDNLEFLAFTNDDKIKKDGIGAEEPGKPSVEEYEGETAGENPSSFLNLDDCITAEPGPGSNYGPDAVVTYRLIGTFVLWNTANSGVGVFS
jgi:hypothetical protein